MTTQHPTPVSLVTGGAGALGSAIAHRLASNGDTVLIFDNNAEAARDQAQRIAEATGSHVEAHTVNLTEQASIRESMADVGQRYGRLDRLVNNAAFNPKTSLERTATEEWDSTMAVNLRAPMALCQAALPIWQATRSGRIVNITSRTWLAGGPTAYVTSKAGIVGLTRSLAVELGPLGVTANAVAPSMVATPFTRGGRTEEEFAAFTERHTRMSPLGRLATAEDIVDAVEFLASAKASFITGEVLHVCGGAQLATAP
ncbi:SDR family NAD(P)-dependent oxidoreductase [Sinomonas gamaensis]|uniref:SDR family NAD(P)-dependent oxidoreductase n=1 Tax=Sinomonas gamaensis TaxID=2565624 RepID=UPI001107AE88|nr:SDR family NAD(P)-dependent oxidoreductase [Sinomonas gamaensis]